MFGRGSKGYRYDNTRKYVRLPAAWPIKYETQAEGAPRQVTHTSDVSAGGVALSVREMLPIGSRIKLEVHVPPLNRSIHAGGEVLRCIPARRGGYEIGIRFDQINPTDQVILNEAIERFYSPRQRSRHRGGAWWRSLP